MEAFEFDHGGRADESLIDKVMSQASAVECKEGIPMF